MRTKLTMQDYVSAFDRLATYRCVYVIETQFDGKASDFFDAPAKLKQFHSLTQAQKDTTYGEVFKNIRHCNWAGMHKEDMMHILGHNYKDSSFMAQFRQRIQALGYTFHKHGTLVYGGERHPYPAKYLPAKQTLFAIFNDEKKVKEILNFRNYTKKEQAVLHRWSTANKTEEQTMKLPSDKTLCQKFNWTQEQLDNMRANGLLESVVARIEKKKAKAKKTKEQALLDQIANLTSMVSQLQQQIAGGVVPNQQPIQEMPKPAPKVIPPDDIDESTTSTQYFKTPYAVVEEFKDMLKEGVGNPWAFKQWIVPIITEYLFKDVETFWATLPSNFRERFAPDNWFGECKPEEQMRICRTRGHFLAMLYKQMSGIFAERMFKDEYVNGRWIAANEKRINAAKTKVKEAYDHAHLAFLKAKNTPQQEEVLEAPHPIVELKVTVSPPPQKKSKEPTMEELEELLNDF